MHSLAEIMKKPDKIGLNEPEDSIFILSNYACIKEFDNRLIEKERQASLVRQGVQNGATQNIF